MKVAGVLLATFISYCTCLAADGPVIRWAVPNPADPRRVIVEVTGMSGFNVPSAQWQSLLTVHVDQSPATSDTPSMMGTYRIDGGTLKFEPRFPLEPGLRYMAELRLDGHAPLSAVFALPAAKPAPPTIVSQIYPSDDVVPENLLKFYVHFSAPMQRGNIYDYIHLRNDQTGKDVEMPFLQLEEELWDPSMTRVTLLIDPGRIKRGVTPLEEIGPALEEGKKFTLTIDRGWKDSAGNELKERFEKRFSVGPPDRTPITPAQWKIEPPQAGTRNALTISFGESLDHALAMRMIQIIDASGVIAGQVSLEDRERQWSLVPASNWKAGPYKIVVTTTIEDLAGNNVGKAFDVDIVEDKQKELPSFNVLIPFDVR